MLIVTDCEPIINGEDTDDKRFFAVRTDYPTRSLAIKTPLNYPEERPKESAFSAILWHSSYGNYLYWLSV